MLVTRPANCVEQCGHKYTIVREPSFLLPVCTPTATLKFQLWFTFMQSKKTKRSFLLPLIKLYMVISPFFLSATHAVLCTLSLLSKPWYTYLTIILRGRMGSESILHEAEGRMGYWLSGHEGERNNCFSKLKSNYLVKKNIETTHPSQVKARHQSFFTAKTLQIWRALFAISRL